MNVYVENLLKEASLSASNMAAGCAAALLHDEALSNPLRFSGNSAAVSASWGLNRFADSVSVLGSNWVGGKLTVWSQIDRMFEQRVASAGRNTIIKLPELIMVTKIEIELESAEPLEVGLLFVGRRTAFPLFGEGFKYSLGVDGKAERTRYGMAYGLKKPSLRSFEISFSDISNGDRLALEEYIDKVQYVQPHLVEPYDGCFPPLYATLADGGGFTKRNEGGFRWDTALSYMEAK